MKIVLPPKNNREQPATLYDVRNITIIGANGAGKSRFAQQIEQQHTHNTVRLSAIHALGYSPDYASSSICCGSIAAKYQEAVQRSRSFRPLETVLTEFDQLIYIMQQEEFLSLQYYKESLKLDPQSQLPTTLLDRVQGVWQQIFPNLKLIRKEGVLQVLDTHSSKSYNAMNMSQGERVAFYMIAASMLVEDGTIILVEDPEAHLHRSIINTLWDYIEQESHSSTFVYLTHDIEFASSRSEGTRIWIKSFDADHNLWDYEFIKGSESFPEEVYLELLGSRKPILFIEGTDTASIDNKLYPHIFPNYMVKPVGGCTKVIEITRAFASMNHFHHLQSMGIVDRDRRTEREVEKLQQQNIFVPDVAEVENLLMLEGVIRVVSRRMMQNHNMVVKKVKRNVIELFKADLDGQVLLHTRHRLRRRIEYMIDRRLHSIAELEEHITTLTDGIDVRELYENIYTQFYTYITERDYLSILMVYNQKGMLPQSNLPQLCGLTGKEKYLAMIIAILKENGADAEELRASLLSVFHFSE